MSEPTTTSVRDDPLLTAREVRDQLRIGKTKFYELINSGELESTLSMPTRSGTKRRRLVRQSVVDAFLTNCTETALTP